MRVTINYTGGETDKMAMATGGYIHERAVTMLERAIHGAYAGGRTREILGDAKVRALLQPGGQYSGDLAAGAVQVKRPGEWDSVGGVIPDLIIYGDTGNPIRIIEVVNTSPPDRAKREKLDRIERRGCEVVLIEVHTEDDLLHLLKRVTVGRFGRKLPVGGRNDWAELQINQSDGEVDKLIGAIMRCTTHKRQALYEVLKQLPTLDSLYPIPLPPEKTTP